MSAPTRHPSDATLVSYAAGALDSGASAVIEQHMAACWDCAATVRLAERLGAAIISTQPASEIPNGALEDVLRRLDQPPKPRGVSGKALDLCEHKMRWAAPDGRFKYHRLWREGQKTLQLVKLAPGSAAPLHKHTGLELMLVLEGRFSDGVTEYLPGDVCEADDEVEHAPRCTAPEGCLCLIYLAGPLRYRSLLQRIRRWLTGL